MDANNDQPVIPTEHQLRVLEGARQRLAACARVSSLRRREHFQHREDESLGLPSLGESASFTASLSNVEVVVGTPFPWEPEAGGRIRGTFLDYEANASSSWALVIDEGTRLQLANAGFDPDMRGREWSLRDQNDTTVINAIVESLMRLDRVRFRVLRPEHLPSGARWPWQGLVQVLAADRILSIEAPVDGKYEITSETGGRTLVTVVDSNDMDLVRWWRDTGSQFPNEEKQR